MIKTSIQEYYDTIRPDKDLKDKMLAEVLDSTLPKGRKRRILWVAAVPALAAVVFAAVLLTGNSGFQTTKPTSGVVAAVVQTPDAPALTSPADGKADQAKAVSDKTDTIDKNAREVKYYFSEGKFNSRIYVNTLQELEDISVAIAEVKVVSSVQRLATENELSLSLNRPRGCAITTVMINKVYKSDGVIKAGDEKKILEYYTTRPNRENANILDVFCVGNTMPMKMEGTYLLFLDKPSHDYGDYEIFGIWMGKFKVSEEIRNASDISKLSKEDIEAAKDKDKNYFYWNLVPQVKEKYIN